MTGDYDNDLRIVATTRRNARAPISARRQVVRAKPRTISLAVGVRRWRPSFEAAGAETVFGDTAVPGAT